LAGLEATIWVRLYIQGPGFYSNRLMGFDLSGIQFGVILTVFTQFSMMLGSHILRYNLNDFHHILGFLIGNLLLSVLSLPTVIIAPELYALLIAEILVSNILLITRLIILTMPQVRKGAVS
jgi:hypothetical protein